MPVALPAITLPAFLVALAVLILALAIAIVIRALLERLVDLAVIGRVIRPVVGLIENHIEDRLRAWIGKTAATMFSFLGGLTDVIQRFGKQVFLTTAGLVLAIAWLVKERLFDETTGAIPKLNNRVTTLRQELYDSRTGDIPEVRRSVSGLRSDLYDHKSGDIPELNARAAGIEAGVRDIQAEELPKLARGIDRVEGVASNAGRIASDAARTAERTASVDVPAVDRRVKAAEGTLDEIAPWTRAVALAVPAALAAEGVFQAARSSKKLDRMCGLDLDDFDDLLSFVLLVPTLGMVYQATREGADIAQELADLAKGVLFAPLGEES